MYPNVRLSKGNLATVKIILKPLNKVQNIQFFDQSKGPFLKHEEVLTFFIVFLGESGWRILLS